jgi:hypothetical protein
MGERRGRGQGRTRNTPTNPTGCKPATTKQQIARMIPANEGKYAPTTDCQIESYFSLSLLSPFNILSVHSIISVSYGYHSPHGLKVVHTRFGRKTYRMESRIPSPQ